jgi:hypothetical protein
MSAKGLQGLLSQVTSRHLGHQGSSRWGTSQEWSITHGTLGRKEEVSGHQLSCLSVAYARRFDDFRYGFHMESITSIK